MQLERDKQHHTSDPLQDSDSLLRAMIENLPGGAAFVVDPDLRYRLAEGEALSVAGFKPEDLVGRTIFEVLPPDLATSYEVLYRKALAGEPFEHEHNAHDRAYISRGTPLRSANGEVYAVLAVSYDITKRKQAEAAVAADLEDTQRLRELSARLVAEDDIQTLYQEIVATAIALTRVDARSIQILDEATQELVMLANQGAGQKLTEHFYRVNAGSNTLCGVALTTGKRTFVDFDVPESEDPHGSMRMHREAGYLSAQSTPLITRSGKAIGMVSTHWRKHHRPSDHELRFLDLLARQAADLIEQRQAQATSRELEAKYRSLFNSINEGYALLEIIYDETETAIDWRLLEVNPAFERSTGFVHSVGKTATELNPTVESSWLEILANVAQTGEAVRFEQYTEGIDYWFDVYASRLDADKRHIVVVFNDITDRKQAEEQLRRGAEMNAFRVKLSDALRSLCDPIEIQRAATHILGEQVQAYRALYAEVEDDGETYLITDNYVGGDYPKLLGRLPVSAFGEVSERLRMGETFVVEDVNADERLSQATNAAAFTGTNAAALVAVSLFKGSRWVCMFGVTSSTVRRWSNNEVAIVAETAERTWAAVERARAEEGLRESTDRPGNVYN